MHGGQGEKAAIRERIKALRDSLTAGQVAEAGQRVCDRLSRSPFLSEARIVCLYAGTGKEVPTAEVMSWLLARGAAVAVPDWEGWKQGSGLRILQVSSPGDLQTAGRIVPQPVDRPDSVMPIDKVEVFIVPGLAFDRTGARIGMGGGFFDRLLALSSPKATLVGIAHDFQVLSSLPVEGHDVPVHAVVTPSAAWDTRDLHKKED